MLFQEDLLASLECLLFISIDSLSLEDISRLLKTNLDETENLLEKYQEMLSASERGLEIKKIAGGYKLQTKQKFSSLVEELVEQKGNPLSRAALETLAIIAYSQPVTRAEVEKIRGVNSDGMFFRLLDKELIYEVGRKNVPGRPILYGTSESFLLELGLSSLEDLPELVDVSPEELNFSEVENVDNYEDK